MVEGDRIITHRLRDDGGMLRVTHTDMDPCPQDCRFLRLDREIVHDSGRKTKMQYCQFAVTDDQVTRYTDEQISDFAGELQGTDENSVNPQEYGDRCYSGVSVTFDDDYVYAAIGDVQVAPLPRAKD